MQTIKVLVNRNFLHFESRGFGRNYSWVGAHRALGAVLHIVDRELDLSLLSDQRVLKERYAAQEDRVTGTLEKKTEREKDEVVLKSQAAGRMEGQVSNSAPQ